MELESLAANIWADTQLDKAARQSVLGEIYAHLLFIDSNRPIHGSAAKTSTCPKSLAPLAWQVLDSMRPLDWYPTCLKQMVLGNAIGNHPSYLACRFGQELTWTRSGAESEISGDSNPQEPKVGGF